MHIFFFFKYPLWGQKRQGPDHTQIKLDGNCIVFIQKVTIQIGSPYSLLIFQIMTQPNALPPPVVAAVNRMLLGALWTKLSKSERWFFR